MKKSITKILAASLAAFALFLGACTSNDAGVSSSADGGASVGAVKPYPKDTCLVTGNDLNSMGGPVVRVYDGQQVKFCCKPCVKKFEASKEKYLSQL
ncbi:MAG: hypothetical protein ACI8UO_002872 [Verrucomicrobiales bacterium]|jgi:hypothetical protein